MVSLLLVLIVIFSNVVSAFAVEQENVVMQRQIQIENGISITEELVEHSFARAQTKDYTWRKTYKQNDTVIAVIAIYGSFSYDGKTVYVLSQKVSQSTTYNGWNYSQTALYSSNGVITLEASLSKLLVLNVPVNMTLGCDKNGNIFAT